MQNNSTSRRFLFWIQRKIALQNEKMQPSFKEGEIWWAAVGENIGIEIDGKGNRFSRPILIIRKYSKDGFFALPLTSQEHSGAWYFKFRFKEKDSYAALTQGKTMSVYRLYKRIGNIPEELLEQIQDAYIETNYPRRAQKYK